MNRGETPDHAEKRFSMKTVIAFVGGMAFCFLAFFPNADPRPPAKPADVQVCGTGPSIDCGQYVLQINTQRGFGRFVLYRVTGTPIDTSTFDNVAGGDTSLTYQAAEPDPRSAYTFTVTASEP